MVAKAESYDYVLEIVKMIKYYFFEYGVNFSNKLLREALQILYWEQNPFLQIKAKMEQEIEEKGVNYGLSSDVFYFHLPGDEPHDEKPKVPQNVLTVQRIDIKQMIKCKICQKYEWELFFDTEKQQLTLMCVNCQNIQVFQMKETS
jgi:hypothetical protein